MLSWLKQWVVDWRALWCPTSWRLIPCTGWVQWWLWWWELVVVALVKRVTWICGLKKFREGLQDALRKNAGSMAFLCAIVLGCVNFCSSLKSSAMCCVLRLFVVGYDQQQPKWPWSALFCCCRQQRHLSLTQYVLNVMVSVSVPALMCGIGGREWGGVGLI